SVWELFPAVLGTELEFACRRAVATGTPQQFEYYYPPFERWFEHWLHPSGDGLTIISTDITERKRADQELRRVKDELAAELDAMHRLHALSTRLLEATELQPILEETLDAALEMLGAEMGHLQLFDPHDHA